PFFICLGGAWGILIANFWWRQSVDEAPRRRVIQALIGFGLGLLAVWLDGFQLPWPGMSVEEMDSLRPLVGPESELPRHRFFDGLYPPNRSIPVLAGSLAYFGLMLAILRWWRLPAQGRERRFELSSVLGVAFWAYVLLFLLPATQQRQEAFLAMV